MKIMIHMHKKNNNKLLKRIIGITATVIILMAAVVAIIFFHLMRKPQIKLVEAMVNTINSSRESEMNQQYGTFDMGMNMINGSQSFSFEDNSDHSVSHRAGGTRCCEKLLRRTDADSSHVFGP